MNQHLRASLTLDEALSTVKLPITVHGADQSMKSRCDQRLMGAAPPFPDDWHKQRAAIYLKPREMVTVRQ